MTDVTIREIADPREITDEPGLPRIPPVSTWEEAEAKLAEARALLARLRAQREA
jgi:hypothetical protein